MRCPSCTPDYCACADFYGGRLKYWKGEINDRDRSELDGSSQNDGALLRLCVWHVGAAPVTAPDLAALSEAATQGPWKKGAKRNCDIDIIGKPTWPCTRYGKKGEWDVAVVTELENVKEQQANATFIVSLVNEYRAGRLVQIDKGMRERVADAIREALTPNTPDWLQEADAAIAAMKGGVE